MEHTEIIHLLLRGDGRSSESPIDCDEYVREFRNKNLTASTIPVLKFAYKNVDHLAHLLGSITLKGSEATIGHYGLIITSPRVVVALSMALELLETHERDQVVQRFNSDLVFAVGQKSSDECDEQLRIKPNCASVQTGNSKNLAEMIKTFCHNNYQNSPIDLIYPKGSRSDTFIEESLAKDGFQEQLHVHPIEIYDTLPSNEVSGDIVEEIKRLKRPVDKRRSVVINLIFFSPSGVEAFLMIDKVAFTKQIDEMFSGCQVEFRYSSIGKTTETALRRNEINVFCVAQKPNPISLVDSILNRSDYR